MLTPAQSLIIIAFASTAQGFCGSSIRWAHQLNIEDAYGIWYGVGYAQHTPDMTNKPNEVGCVTLYISDASVEGQDDWLDWSIMKRNYSNENWRSHKNNPWSETRMAGSWLDVRLKRNVKRDIYNERRLRIIWDEDGQTMEQVYVYSPESPGLWVVEQKQPLETLLQSRGVDVWFPEETPRHPEVIRVLKVNPHMMIINHCSDKGGGGIFSLILRRSPYKMERWEWYDLQRQFFRFELPNMYRYSAICAACVQMSSLFYIIFSIAVLILI